MNKERPRVVIAHDFMETYGGAERVTAELAAAFPDAPVYAIAGRREVAERMGVADRFHSLMRPDERLLRHYRKLAPIFPRVVDHARLPAADVLVTSSYAFAHGLRTVNGAPQVCYCHSPLRFAWSQTDAYRELLADGHARGAAFDMLAARMRRNDLRFSARVGTYVTQSPFIGEQIARFYGRKAESVGAPVDCDRFRPDGREPDDHYLFCGRLIEPYKRVRMTIEAFRRLPDERLVIAGDGPAREELQRIAPPNVEFVGHHRDDALVRLFQRCKAVVFPSVDDFGLVPVEAMACGRPVLAFAGGGALHTVVPGVTGEHFAEPTVDALAGALRAFEPAHYDRWAIRVEALRYDAKLFRERMTGIVNAAAVERRAPARIGRFASTGGTEVAA